MRGLKPWLVASLLVVAAVAVVQVVRVARADPIAELRDELAVLRASADSCRVAVDTGEAELQAYSVRLDSMKARVRQYEALDPRGVPADSYSIYMNAFQLYNDSAAQWTGRVAALQADLGRCRAVTEQHNSAADSLRRLMSRSR